MSEMIPKIDRIIDRFIEGWVRCDNFRKQHAKLLSDLSESPFTRIFSQFCQSRGFISSGRATSLNLIEPRRQIGDTKY